jgi:4-amino-4-deoxy-L-arabinose transferase-like glycosyltransferase
MSKSWHNFFFAAFDPGGFLAVDKPPLGLWLQVASVKLLGFGGLSLLLPQALAGAASVAVLTLGQPLQPRSRPAGGSGAGRHPPVAVVVDRNNTMDATLVVLLVLAA